MKLNASCLLASLLLVAHGVMAQSEDEDEAVTRTETTAELPATEEACFNTREVRSFDALTDRFVYVETRGDEHYLLTMSGVCLNLRSAVGITIASEFSRVCSSGRARIQYRDFGRLQTCRIFRVESVPDKETAERVVEERR
jgi:hypothetical protein